MNKVLITGSSGFIGSHLQEALANLNVQTYCYDIAEGDVSDASTWNQYKKANVVIHLAAMSFVPDSWQHPGDFLRCNLLGTINALDYCMRHEAKLILLSSYLYGNPKSLPIPETTNLEPTNPYALSKKVSEEVCQFYCKFFKINVIVLRPFNVYGPGQPQNSLIPEIIDQVKNNDKIIVNDFEPKRDYIYVTDLVDAVIKSIETNIEGFSAFNIGSGESYSVKEVIDLIQKINNSNKPVISKNVRRRNEIMNTIADVHKAKIILGWKINWSLTKGLSALLS